MLPFFKNDIEIDIENDIEYSFVLLMINRFIHP